MSLFLVLTGSVVVVGLYFAALFAVDRQKLFAVDRQKRKQTLRRLIEGDSIALHLLLNESGLNAEHLRKEILAGKEAAFADGNYADFLRINKFAGMLLTHEEMYDILNAEKKPGKDFIPLLLSEAIRMKNRELVHHEAKMRLLNMCVSYVKDAHDDLTLQTYLEIVILASYTDGGVDILSELYEFLGKFEHGEEREICVAGMVYIQRRQTDNAHDELLRLHCITHVLRNALFHPTDRPWGLVNDYTQPEPELLAGLLKRKEKESNPAQSTT